MTTAVETIARTPSTAAKPRAEHAKASEISLTGVLTTSIWMACMTIGVVGIVVPYARPQAPKPGPAPIEAQLLEVALTTDSIAIPDIAPPPQNTLPPPPTVKPISPPSAPALIPVAAPNPAIAFELPVAGPTRVVEAKEASYSTPATPPAENAAPVVTELTFGVGEGKQAKPEYPPRALSEGQEGTVRIELTIGADGRVAAAEIASASPWPLLNRAALKVVRERWRFARGPVRRHQVALHFRIQR